MKNAWLKYAEGERKKVFEFCEGYKDYLSQSKTEREAVKNAISIAEKAGYKNIKDLKSVKPGDKVYAEFMEKSLTLFHIGSEPIENGLKILGAHVDSPRLDLKANPIYEDEVSRICLLDTHYYGRIRNYQYVAMPLAIHGVVIKKDGSKINICIGEDVSEPVFCVSDLLPHLKRNSSGLKKKDEVDPIAGELLDVIVGSIPADENRLGTKRIILDILKAQNIDEEDLISSEIEIVPAGKARDLGLDRSMILGYGQDDKVCAYTSLMAMLEVKNPKKTVACILTDKEEIGSSGATGMTSRYFENFLAQVIDLLGEYSEIKLKKALSNSMMLSSDVTAGFDPLYKGAFNDKTDAFIGAGVGFCKYTGSNGKSNASDANPEFIAYLRNILDESNVNYQFTEMGKVDQGGGGTIAKYMAAYGMNVIDCGVPVLSMHAPWEITSKVDVYEAYKCYKVFVK